MYKLKKITIASLMLFLLLSPFIHVLAFTPLNLDTVNIDSQDTSLIGKAGYEQVGEEGVGQVMATVIKAFLGLLGVIFIVLIVYAGYNYMSAAGEEAKVEKAITTIQRAIIGLIIIVAAYAITAFVFNNMPSGGGSGSNINAGP